MADLDIWGSKDLYSSGEEDAGLETKRAPSPPRQSSFGGSSKGMRAFTTPPQQQPRAVAGGLEAKEPGSSGDMPIRIISSDLVQGGTGSTPPTSDIEFAPPSSDVVADRSGSDTVEIQLGKKSFEVTQNGQVIAYITPRTRAGTWWKSVAALSTAAGVGSVVAAIGAKPHLKRLLDATRTRFGQGKRGKGEVVVGGALLVLLLFAAMYSFQRKSRKHLFTVSYDVTTPDGKFEFTTGTFNGAVVTVQSRTTGRRFDITPTPSADNKPAGTFIQELVEADGGLAGKPFAETVPVQIESEKKLRGSPVEIITAVTLKQTVGRDPEIRILQALAGLLDYDRNVKWIFPVLWQNFKSVAPGLIGGTAFATLLAATGKLNLGQRDSAKLTQTVSQLATGGTPTAGSVVLLTPSEKALQEAKKKTKAASKALAAAKTEDERTRLEAELKTAQEQETAAGVAASEALNLS